MPALAGRTDYVAINFDCGGFVNEADSPVFIFMGEKINRFTITIDRIIGNFRTAICS